MLKIHSFKVHQMLNDPRVKERINSKITINNKFCIPYLAGTNKKSTVVYVDKHFNPIMKDGTNVMAFLVHHELLEKALIDFFGLNYDYAHKIATESELNMVKKAGIDIQTYKDFYKVPIKKSEAEHTGNAPSDLEIKQYADSGDLKKYQRLGI